MAAFNISKSFYIIHGGKIENNYLADFWILNVNNSTWMEIEISGDITAPRAGGNMIYFKNEVLIMGGWND